MHSQFEQLLTKKALISLTPQNSRFKFIQFTTFIKSMKKSEIISQVASASGIDKADVKLIIDNLFDIIMDDVILQGNTLHYGTHCGIIPKVKTANKYAVIKPSKSFRTRHGIQPD